MAIVFPASPSVNETFTVGSITYKWDGDKWIGLGVTPADRLVEGSNSLEIDANNNLVWSGGNLLVGKPAGNFVLDVEKSDENTLRLSNSAETTHGSHDTKLVSGRSFYSNFLLQASSYKFQTWNGSAIADRLRVTSDGDVGIGIDFPEGKLHVHGTVRYVQTISSETGVTAGTTSGTIYRQQYTTTAGTSRRMGFFGIERKGGSGDQTAKFTMELCPDNSTNLGLGSPAANTTAFQFDNNGRMWVKSGGGIDFSANGNAAGIQSEVLNDYEEGYATVTMTCGTSGTITLSNDEVSYVKVGDLVNIHGRLDVSSVSSPNGELIVNLPFNAANEGNGAYASHSAVSLFIWNANSGAGYSQTGLWVGWISPNDNKIRIRYGNSATPAGSGAGGMQAGTEVRFTATFRTV